ncbi:MAG: prolyl aminopeptidase [endosymbiont of Galathealinum brachiosum]|uniref:Proline iminopeptidase n=1 Tax=endosymbiont of Galathealinum brachiosum TaxID=2200906 RepID=A0A370DDB6_9GAMM|nr:MAG: prolyl aminopeptidase [endosymbiont of Galathealinum brachiosum]
MSNLYNSIKPYVSHHLQVDDLHTLYIEECGNPAGLPLVFLHGGPGAGCAPYHRRYFDPDVYRIILFDQRGCGKSTPHASLERNTSWDLVADIEVIRRHLNIDKWVVFGGSWGSTLGLLYAQTHPASVSGLILRGIFLARDKDVQWFYQQGTSKLFPDYWEKFIEPIPESERGDMVAAYSRQLTGDDEIQQLRAARAWSVWEGMTATLQTDKTVVDSFSNSHTALSVARIECHYFMHHCWLEPNQLINNIDVIRNIPAYIVQGRYDVICPVEQAWELSKAWPEAKLSIIGDAGHAIVESGITNELLDVIKEMSKKLT